MHILQLCHKPPHPPHDGGSIAMDQLTRGLLAKGVRVKVMALAPSGTERIAENVPDQYREKTGFEAFPVDTRVRPWPAFLHLFSCKSYNITRFYSPAFAKRLRKVLESTHFDIIQLEGLFLTPYIPVIRQCTGSPVIYRSHNIEHFIWERMAKAARNPFKKTYLSILASRLKKYELNTVYKVDGLVAISPVDQLFFKKNGFSHPSVTIPVGVDNTWLQEPNVKKKNNTVFHLGSMDWRPNQEGLHWFLNEVWPRVTKKMPGLRFVLAGKNIPPSFYRYQDISVAVAGEIPDARTFMHQHRLMVVPLLSGGGMRVKIIEGMAAGKAIVSTSIGAEGIDCTHGGNILLADTATEMAETIVYSFSDQEVMDQMERQAKEFAIQNHTLEPIIERLEAFYKGF